MTKRSTARICQQPQRPISSGLTLTVLERRRTMRPCSLIHLASFSGGKKNRGELALGAF